MIGEVLNIASHNVAEDPSGKPKPAKPCGEYFLNKIGKPALYLPRLSVVSSPLLQQELKAMVA